MNIEHPAELIAYLRQAGHLGPHQPARCQTLSGGVSNRTVLVDLDNGPRWVVKQALRKLRVKEDWFADPGRVHREAMGLHWLAQLTPPGAVPKLVLEDPAEHLVVMEAVPDPHENWKSQLLSCRIEEPSVRQFGELLGTIHAGSVQRRNELEPLFADRSYFESLRIEPYYRFTAARCSWAADFFASLIDDTLRCRQSLVHGDFSPKNVLVYSGRLVLLDHEVIHWGDPAFDVGFAMTHFLSKANHRADFRRAFCQAAERFWATYCQTIDGTLDVADLEPRACRHTLGLLLARVDGRSPLEYLRADEQARQRAVVRCLIGSVPIRIVDLIQRYVQPLEA